MDQVPPPTPAASTRDTVGDLAVVVGDLLLMNGRLNLACIALRQGILHLIEGDRDAALREMANALEVQEQIHRETDTTFTEYKALMLRFAGESDG